MLKMRPISKRIQRLRRFKFRKGYGVHSPFVFSLITSLVEDNTPYYCFESLNKQTIALAKERKIEKTVLPMRKKRELLFRLVNRFKPAAFYLLGDNTGIISLYLQAALEGRALYECNGTVAEGLAFLKSRENNSSSSAFLYLNAATYQGDAVSFYRVLSLIAREDDIVVIDNISKSHVCKEQWQDLAGAPRATVVLDLWDMGIVFFNTKYHKKLYKVRF